MWRDRLNDAKRKFSIQFDLENDEPCQERIIKIDQTQWDFTDCKFKCVLCAAGGDWEMPVNYFRCQLINGYAYDLLNHKDLYRDDFFIVIPDKDGGNHHLLPGESKKWIAPYNDDYDEDIDPRVNDNDCWKFLKEYLDKMVQAAIKQIDRKSEKQGKESSRV